jgi:hypothetical protein
LDDSEGPGSIPPLDAFLAAAEGALSAVAAAMRAEGVAAEVVRGREVGPSSTVCLSIGSARLAVGVRAERGGWWVVAHTLPSGRQFASAPLDGLGQEWVGGVVLAWAELALTSRPTNWRDAVPDIAGPWCAAK